MSLSIKLQNCTTNNTVYAYITGYDIDDHNKCMFVLGDGTKYYPPSPPQGQTNQPVPKDVAIVLPKPLGALDMKLPHIAGCRIWFSTGKKMTFGLNPGPALVEPSVTNNSDPNININWAFCELTYNLDVCFCNISCVDFVSLLPISLTLETRDGKGDHVSGMSVIGINSVLRGLHAQTQIDKQPWDKLVVNGPNGKPLRILAPNNAIVGDGSIFKGYFDGYIQQVWDKYKEGGPKIEVDTQRGDFGTVKANVNSAGKLDFGNGVSFSKPSTADVLTCASGPFQPGPNQLQLAILPRLAAGFNRSTLLDSPITPVPDGPRPFYKNPITNHYSRIVHENLLDGRGYGFPYDDVCQSGGPDQCGAVYNGQPKLLTIAVGGNAAYVTPGAAGVIEQ